MSVPSKQTRRHMMVSSIIKTSRLSLKPCGKPRRPSSIRTWMGIWTWRRNSSSSEGAPVANTPHSKRPSESKWSLTLSSSASTAQHSARTLRHFTAKTLKLVTHQSLSSISTNPSTPSISRSIGAVTWRSPHRIASIAWGPKMWSSARRRILKACSSNCRTWVKCPLSLSFKAPKTLTHTNSSRWRP